MGKYVSMTGASGCRKWGIGTIRKFTLLLLAISTISLLVLSCSNTDDTSDTTIDDDNDLHTSYPITVTDILGRTILLDEKPSRIVTLHPTATETLYRVGGIAIGCDTASSYPAEVESLPTVGGSYNPSVEAVTALNPDLIILEALSQVMFVPTFEALNVPVVTIRAASLDDIQQGLLLIGQIIDMNQSATQAINEIESRIEIAKDTTRPGRNVLIIISDADRNIYAAKPDSYPGTLLELLSQENLAEGLPDSGPYPGFATYTAEQALISNPDAIFAISPAPPPAPRLSEMLPMVPGFNNMDVVKAGSVVELDPVLFLQAQGPRIVDAIEELASFLNEVAP